MMLFAAIAILAILTGLCLGALAALGGALTVATLDDRNARLAGIAIGAGGMALFVASATMPAQTVIA